MARYSYSELKNKYDGFQEPVSIVKVNDKKISDDKNKFIKTSVKHGADAFIASRLDRVHTIA